MSRVLIGYVVRAHGIKGALRVRPTSERAAETAAVLGKVKGLYLDEAAFALTRVRVDKDELLVELAGLADRTLAEALRGRGVYVERQVLPPLRDDELYLSDLVGCEVVDRAGARIGRVTGSVHTGAHETLMVETARGERLLPFVEPLLVAVELDARRVTYDPPPGLLDLDEAEEA